MGVYYSGLARGISKSTANRFVNLVGGENIFAIHSGHVDHNDFFAHASAHGERFGAIIGPLAADYAIGGAIFKTLTTGYHLWQATRTFGYAGSLSSTLYAGSRLQAPESLWTTAETFLFTRHVGGISTNAKNCLSREKIKSYLSNIQTLSKEEIISDIQATGLRIRGKSPDGRFIEFQDKLNNIRIKMHPADKITPYDHLHLYDRKGNSLNSQLKAVDRRSAEAHIPVGVNHENIR
jgi:hypothetical protein